MFYYISGKLALLDPTFAVVDAGGVGYKLSISQTTYSQLSHKLSTTSNENTTLYTYMSVREDGIELFGFYSVLNLHSLFCLHGLRAINSLDISLCAIAKSAKEPAKIEVEDHRAVVAPLQRGKDNGGNGKQRE